MRITFILGLTLLISACAPFSQTRDNRPAEERWQQRLQQQAMLENWAFRGRTAIVQGHEGWNASLSWEQQADEFAIKLSGPFSQGGASLQGDEQAVMLTLNNGETYQAASPEQLLAERMGWLLPVSALRDWIRGVPYSKLPVDNKELDEYGRLSKLEQGGWTINYLGYMPFDDTSMPAKVFMKHTDLTLRVIIQKWHHPE